MWGEGQKHCFFKGWVWVTTRDPIKQIILHFFFYFTQFIFLFKNKGEFSRGFTYRVTHIWCASWTVHFSVSIFSRSTRLEAYHSPKVHQQVDNIITFPSTILYFLSFFFLRGNFIIIIYNNILTPAKSFFLSSNDLVSTRRSYLEATWIFGWNNIESDFNIHLLKKQNLIIS